MLRMDLLAAIGSTPRSLSGYLVTSTTPSSGRDNKLVTPLLLFPWEDENNHQLSQRRATSHEARLSFINTQLFSFYF